MFGLSLACSIRVFFRFYCSITIIYLCVYIYTLCSLCIIFVYVYVCMYICVYIYVCVYICIIYIIYYKYTWVCIRVCVRVSFFSLFLYYKCKILTCMYLRSRDLNRTHCSPLRNLRVSYMPRERNRGTRGRSVDKKERSLFWFYTRATSEHHTCKRAIPPRSDSKESFCTRVLH